VSGIDKDLFRALFGRVSRCSFDTYRQHFLMRLPRLLLRSAQESAPAITDCTGFEELAKCLDAPATDAQTWKNAELFPYLNYVAFPKNDKRQQCIDALRVHCQITQLTGETNPDVEYWRLPHISSSQKVEVVWFEHQSARRRLDLGWRIDVQKRAVVVYRPYSNLFDDVEPNLYGAQSSSKMNDELELLVREAFSIVDQYSQSLFENIVDHISTISLLKETVGRPKSHSLRNRYIGAIFITIASPIEMAEQIIHEYYHQCIWPWWLVEPPEDLPDVSLQVTSPISGAARSMPTMVQAILIYSSLQDFYTFSIERSVTGRDTAAADRALARASTIRQRFDELVATVLQELRDREATRAVVGAILQLRQEMLIC
jgi:hypothetical protein